MKIVIWSHLLLLACSSAILFSALFAQYLINPIGAVACFAGSIHAAAHMANGLGTGVFPWGKGTCSKTQRPMIFWILMIASAILCLGFLVIGLAILGVFT
jgi:succinate dehydrogenase/fumarate reductase cytochrome b subunit